MAAIQSGRILINPVFSFAFSSKTRYTYLLGSSAITVPEAPAARAMGMVVSPHVRTDIYSKITGLDKLPVKYNQSCVEFQWLIKRMLPLCNLHRSILPHLESFYNRPVFVKFLFQFFSTETVKEVI